MKIALLTQDHPRNWASLDSIISNIVKMYKPFAKTKLISVGVNQDFYNFLDPLRAFEPDVVVFLDNRLQEPGLIPLINTYLKKEPRYIFYLYGGHIHWALPMWRMHENSLLGQSIDFICASQTVVKMQEQFIANKKALHYIPYSLSNRPIPTRERQNETHLCYIGRLSIQKNWETMIEWLDTYRDEKKVDLRLHLAGKCDQLGSPGSQEGIMEHALASALKHRPWISFHGFLQPKPLSELIQKCSASVSLSTYFDEDFGYALAEAFSLGIPAILTAWCGHKDFIRLFPELCHPVKVRKEAPGLMITYDDFSLALDTFLTSPEHSSKDVARKFQKHFSPQALSLDLEKVCKRRSTFSGLTKLARTIHGVSVYEADDLSKLYGPYYE